MFSIFTLYKDFFCVLKILEYIPFVVTIVISVAAKKLKVGCYFNAIEIYSI